MDAKGNWTVGVVSERLARNLATVKNYECIKIAPNKFLVYNPKYYTEIDYGMQEGFYFLNRTV